jgi:hypothetical protein
LAALALVLSFHPGYFLCRLARPHAGLGRYLPQVHRALHRSVVSIDFCCAERWFPCRRPVRTPFSVESAFCLSSCSLAQVFLHRFQSVACKRSSSHRLSRPTSVFSSASVPAARLCCGCLLFAAQGTSFAACCFLFNGSALSGQSCRSRLPLFSACVLRTPARLALVVILPFCWVH